MTSKVNLRSEISKILKRLAGYMMADAIQVAIEGNKKDFDLKELQPFINQLLALIKKHERELIGEAETLLGYYSCGQHKKLKRLLAKLKEVEK